MPDSDSAQGDEQRRRSETGGMKRLRRRGRTSLLARGEPMIWLTGGGLALSLLMIVGLLLLIFYQGLFTFWPSEVVSVRLHDGTRFMGEVTRDDDFAPERDQIDPLQGPARAAAEAELAASPGTVHRKLIRTGNFDVTQTHFNWVRDYQIAERELPEWALVLERMVNGRFYGFPEALVLRHPRRVAAQEEVLLALITHLRGRLGQLAEAKQERAEAYIGQLERKWSAERRAASAAFVEELGAERVPGEPERIAIVPGGAEVPLAELGDDAVVDEVRFIWRGPGAAWEQYRRLHREAVDLRDRRHAIEKYDIGEVNRALEEARLAVREAELAHGVKLLPLLRGIGEQRRRVQQLERDFEQLRGLASDAALFGNGLQGLDGFVRAIDAELIAERRAEFHRAQRELDALREEVAVMDPAIADAFAGAAQAAAWAEKRNAELLGSIAQIRQRNERLRLRMATVDGVTTDLLLRDVVRAYPANQLDVGDKFGIYWSRWWEFLSADPREANSEGGVFPAIFGTVIMTLIMSIVVVPFGVLAALYLREYAKGGAIVSTIRIAINNLAGVPSIVFGVFGLGFFCYVVGDLIDGGPNVTLGEGTWYAMLVGLVLLVVAAVTLSVFNARASKDLGGRRRTPLGFALPVLWLAAVGMLVALVTFTPFFDGFYRAKLPNPTYGTGGIMWASLTLALLTLPVVIVATEEALSAVPRSMREGSYACGASKWQTIKRIVLPRAMPGIMTGTILAMARGAGEVAPLMLVGAVKLAPELPVELSDWSGSLGLLPLGPLHPERSFMHLGFHIYDLGFQSQNSEAAKPMVYTTTLLLIMIILSLNLAAIYLRARLRRRFTGDQF